MIPMAIDSKQLIEDLSQWGWLDFKIETVCGFSRGYVAQIRCGNIKEMSYARAARLYNFWLEEEEKNRPSIVFGVVSTAIPPTTKLSSIMRTT
jgi:hypothetical protein